jgi:hypothetical protein
LLGALMAAGCYNSPPHYSWEAEPVQISPRFAVASDAYSTSVQLGPYLIRLTLSQDGLELQIPNEEVSASVRVEVPVEHQEQAVVWVWLGHSPDWNSLKSGLIVRSVIYEQARNTTGKNSICVPWKQLAVLGAKSTPPERLGITLVAQDRNLGFVWVHVN